MRILFPDMWFEGESDLETGPFSPEHDLRCFWALAPSEVPDEEWRMCEAIVFGNQFPLPPDLVRQLDNCKIIAVAAIGVDYIPLEMCNNKGIHVCNLPDYGIDDVADHTIGLLLALSRQIPIFSELVRADAIENWTAWTNRPMTLSKRLSRRVVGVVGQGRIGQAVTRRLEAFGAKILVYDPYVSAPTDSTNIARTATLDDLLSQSDIISLHVPLTDETHHLINTNTIAQMKDGVVIVNTSRGKLIDHAALAEALVSKKVAAAALDVLNDEPPGAADPMVRLFQQDSSVGHERLIVTPHMAFYSDASVEALRSGPAQIVAEFIRSGHAVNCVNGEALRRHMPAGQTT